MKEMKFGNPQCLCGQTMPITELRVHQSKCAIWQFAQHRSGSPDQIYDQQRFTPEEWAVLDHLAKAWNAFCNLPKQHINDAEEFCHAIHAAQRVVGVRPIRIPE